MAANVRCFISAARRAGRGGCPLAVSALLLLGAGLAAAVAAPGFDLLPAATVDSRGIYLHQVVSSPRSDLPPVRLVDAPIFGQTALISRAQFLALLIKAAPELATNANAAGGSAQVRITRRARPLPETELRDLLTATLQGQVVKDRGDLELRLSRPWSPVLVPDEPLELKTLDLPASGISPTFIVRFEITSGSDRIGPWQVVVQARVLKEVAVARSNLKRGQPLGDADVGTERRDVISLHEPLDGASLAEGGVELNENIAAGQPLLARSVRRRPVILRGQLIDGLMLDGALQISLKVEALADGLPGQSIRVRNPKTKREFYAKVQNDQSVLLN